MISQRARGRAGRRAVLRPGPALAGAAGAMLLMAVWPAVPVLAAGVPDTPAAPASGLLPVLVGDVTTLLTALLGPGPAAAGAGTPAPGVPAVVPAADPVPLRPPAAAAAVPAAVPGTGAAAVPPAQWVTQTISRPVPYPVRYQPDPQLVRGQERVLRPGRDGERESVRAELEKGGHILAVRQQGSRAVVPPVAEVVEYGTAPPVSRGGPGPFVRELTMLATAYWPDPRWSDGITASGLPARYGVVAVDPRVIPLGTRLYIPGYGFAIAADTGAAIVGDRIDLCFDTRRQAVDFGVRTIPVYVLG